MRALMTGLILIVSLAGCQDTGSGKCIVGAKTYGAGDTFPSEDGCNTCTCETTGDVACTERACAPGPDGGGGGPDGGDIVQCTGAMPTFPTFNKHCAGPTDCVVALHQINCCGSRTAIGINKSEVTRFNGDEQRCELQYPGCGCAAAPTVAEDGKSSMAPDDIAVTCTAGSCMSYIK